MSTTRLIAAALLLFGASAVALAQARPAGISAAITPEKIDVTLHEPVSTLLTLRNGLSEPVVVDLGDDRKSGIVVKTIFPDGSRGSNQVSVHQGLARLGRITLARDEIYSQVLVFNDWTVFPMTGLYKLRVELLNPVVASDGTSIRLGAFFASVTVESRDEQRLNKLCAALLDRLSRARSYADARQQAELLARVEDPVAVPFLRQAMTSPFYPIQPLIVRGLEGVGTPEAVKVLLEAIGKDPSAAPDARAALSRLADKILDVDLKTQVQKTLNDKP